MTVDNLKQLEQHLRQAAALADQALARTGLSGLSPPTPAQELAVALRQAVADAQHLVRAECVVRLGGHSWFALPPSAP